MVLKIFNILFLSLFILNQSIAYGQLTDNLQAFLTTKPNQKGTSLFEEVRGSLAETELLIDEYLEEGSYLKAYDLVVKAKNSFPSLGSKEAAIKDILYGIFHDIKSPTVTLKSNLQIVDFLYGDLKASDPTFFEEVNGLANLSDDLIDLLFNPSNRDQESDISISHKLREFSERAIAAFLAYERVLGRIAEDSQIAENLGDKGMLAFKGGFGASIKLLAFFAYEFFSDYITFEMEFSKEVDLETYFASNETFKRLYHSKNISFSINKPQSGLPKVLIDELGFYRIFGNLMSNLKEHGGIFGADNQLYNFRDEVVGFSLNFIYETGKDRLSVQFKENGNPIGYNKKTKEYDPKYVSFYSKDELYNFVTSEEITETAYQQVVAAMNEFGIDRIQYLFVAGVSTGSDKLNAGLGMFNVWKLLKGKVTASNVKTSGEVYTDSDPMFRNINEDLEYSGVEFYLEFDVTEKPLDLAQPIQQFLKSA